MRSTLRSALVLCGSGILAICLGGELNALISGDKAKQLAGSVVATSGVAVRHVDRGENCVPAWGIQSKAGAALFPAKYNERCAPFAERARVDDRHLLVDTVRPIKCRSTFNAVRDRAAIISDKDTQARGAVPPLLKLNALDPQIGTGFRIPYLSRNFDGLIGSIGSAARLVDGFGGGNGRIFGVSERAPDQEHTYTGERYGEGRCEKHKFCPMGHPLLGVQIAFFAFGVPLILWLVYEGYQVADRGFDAFDGNYKAPAAWLFLFGAILAFGSAGLLPGLGYWLVFEGGIWRFL